jgi:prepilin signal peptidase PulO-like enzyme (type II secretory pathway)
LQGAGLLRFVLWLVFLVGFVILTVYDLRWKLLPNKVVYPLIVLAVLQVILLVIFYSAGVSAVTGAAVGALIISGGFYLLFQVSAGKWIGGGDVKLGIVLGALSGGAEQALLLLFIASFSGTLITLPLLLDKKLKAKATIPFGPFLLLAAVIGQLFGASLIRWYTHLVI